MKNLINSELKNQIGGGAEMRFINANGSVDPTSLGFQIAIDTLTYIRKTVVEQHFYEVPFADFIPTVVGEGAFSQSILTNVTFSNADDFESGVIDTGSDNSRIATVDAGVAPKTVAVINWAKEIGYTVFDIEQALRASNWDIIEGKVRARKKNWDLGLQEIAFLGSKTNKNVTGLLTSAEVNVNTALITKPLSSMTAAELNAFAASFMSSFWTNSGSTRLPNNFVIPASDYLGLANTMSEQFPVKSKLEFLQEAFGKMSPGFRITWTAYGDAARMATRGVNHARYAAYYFDPETIRMDIPVDFTTTAPNSLNNFSFQDVAYGQYTGVGIYRPLEVLYYDITA